MSRRHLMGAAPDEYDNPWTKRLERELRAREPRESSAPGPEAFVAAGWALAAALMLIQWVIS